MRLIHHFQPEINRRFTITGKMKQSKKKKKNSRIVIHGIDQTMLQLSQWTKHSASLLG